jgi:hypothetical protein
MAATTPENVDRIESAANITLNITQGASQGSGNAEIVEVPISRLDTTKDISIEQARENSIKATGYSITSIEYSGTMMFKGSRKTKTLPDGSQVSLDDLLYDEHGVPEPVSISITHDLLPDGDSGKTETYTTVLVTSESYESRSEEMNETSYDFIAMNRTSDSPRKADSTTRK